MGERGPAVVVSARRRRLLATARRARGSGALVCGSALTLAVCAVAVLDRRIAPGYAFATSAADRLASPSAAHPMGTDQLGRDVLTAVVQGAHTTIGVVAGVVAIVAVVGTLAGAVAGLRGGVLDDVVMRLVEVVQTVPRFFLAVLVVGWFGPGRPLTMLLGLTSWPLLARVVRVQTMSLRHRGFVEAARSMGAGDLRILVRHVVPNVLPGAAVVLALTGSRVVLLEAGLAFLGLADANVPSWGSLVSNAQPYFQSAWWLCVFPGAAISVTIIGMNLLADGLAAVSDPAGAEAGTWRAAQASSVAGS